MDPQMLMMLMQMKQGISAGGGQFLQGWLGNSDRPYNKAGDVYEQHSKEAQRFQNPFYEAGQRGMGNYEEWLQGQKDPSGFVNKLMNNYQESPYATFQKTQGQNAANNAASASGLTGSTPFAQASADYAQNITSQDQNKWLEHVLGVNTQYGQGNMNLMQGGQNAANMLSQLQEHLGNYRGDTTYGAEMGKNKDRGDMWSGGLKFLTG